MKNSIFSTTKITKNTLTVNSLKDQLPTVNDVAFSLPLVLAWRKVDCSEGDRDVRAVAT